MKSGVQLGAAAMAAPVLFCAGLIAGFIAIPARPQFDPGNLLWVLLVYPISEEIVFRGGIQAVLLRRLRARTFLPGFSLPNLLTSVLFALAHVWYHGSLWISLVFLPSLVFGWSYELTGRLWAPIILHSWYNLVGLFWYWSGY